MRARFGVAAAFVAVVVALILIRDAGYLGGRTEGGPLSVGLGGEALALRVASGRTATVAGRAELDGDPVEVTRVRPDFRSPGLRLRAARLGDREDADYPRAGPLIVGAEYDGAQDIFLGLKAKRPGAYYALGLITDYKSGVRRFRDYDSQTVCILVGEDARCDPDARRFDAPLAEVGGPSDYGAAVGSDGVRVPAGREVRLTLANLTNAAIEVSDVEGVRPDAFSLRRGGGRTVRFTPEDCGSVEALRARVDDEPVDVPLTVTLQVRC